MSVVKVRAALETALNSITPAIGCAWENVGYTPVVGTPYQRVYMMFAQPDNQVHGGEHIEQGYMQIDLMYPTGTGPNAASARAELLRTTFARGSSFASGGVTTVINRTPEVAPGVIEDGRYRVTVRIPFFANIH